MAGKVRRLTGALGRIKEWDALVNRPMPEHQDAYTEVADQRVPGGGIASNMQDLWNTYAELLRKNVDPTGELSTFPAIKLAPSVREYVTEHGLNLFAEGGLVRGFARGGKVRGALRTLQEYGDTLAPQQGFFSTLDRLVQEAPFERAPADQWMGYLKPGRMYRESGMQFPLKGEELKYSRLGPNLEGLEGPVGREHVLRVLREGRGPEYRLTEGLEQQTIDDLMLFPDHSPLREARLKDSDLTRAGVNEPEFGPGQGYERLSYQTANSTYEESITRLADLKQRIPGGHFGDDVVSWSRASSHDLFEPTAADPAGHKRVRLVDEVQSSYHRAASARPDWQPYRTMDELARYEALNGESIQLSMARPGTEGQHRPKAEIDADLQAIRDAAKARAPRRRGYREYNEFLELRQKVDQAAQEFRDFNDGRPASREYIAATMSEAEYKRYEELKAALPDVPFKDPSEYGAFELRKQLINAVDAGEDYLALTRGSDQAEHYGMTSREASESKRYYDGVYAGELKKLARRYGAELTEIELPVKTARDVRPPSMREFNWESPDHMLDTVMELIIDANDTDDVTGGLAVLHEFLSETVRGGEGSTLASQANIIRQELSETEELLLSGFGADADTPGMKILDTGFDRLGNLRSRLNNYYNMYTRSLGPLDTLKSKTFMALRITPEVAERVREVGVPLWGAGAGAVGLGAADEDRKPEGFARGGTVSLPSNEFFDDPRSSAELTQLEGLVKQLKADDLAATAHEDTRPPSHRLLSRVQGGFQGQWKTLDPATGESKWASPLDEDFRPGIFDDIVGLPSAFGADIDVSRQANERFETLRRDIQGDMGLDPAEGFLEHGAEMLGMMLAQVPVPGGPMKAVGRGVKKIGVDVLGIPALIRKPVRFGSEFFNPVVQPGVTNYLGGATFGAVLGMVSDPSERARLESEINRLALLSQEVPYEQWSAEDRESDRRLKVTIEELQLEYRQKQLQLTSERISPAAELNSRRRHRN